MKVLNEIDDEQQKIQSVSFDIIEIFNVKYVLGQNKLLY